MSGMRVPDAWDASIKPNPAVFHEKIAGFFLGAVDPGHGLCLFNNILRAVRLAGPCFESFPTI